MQSTTMSKAHQANHLVSCQIKVILTVLCGRWDLMHTLPISQ